TTVFSVRHPLDHGRGSVTFEAPLVYLDTNELVADGGFSDLKIEFNYNYHIDCDATWTVFPLLEFYIPTKGENGFSGELLSLDVGLRRFAVGPGVVLVRNTLFT